MKGDMDDPVIVLVKSTEFLSGRSIPDVSHTVSEEILFIVGMPNDSIAIHHADGTFPIRAETHEMEELAGALQPHPFAGLLLKGRHSIDLGKRAKSVLADKRNARKQAS